MGTMDTKKKIFESNRQVGERRSSTVPSKLKTLTSPLPAELPEDSSSLQLLSSKKVFWQHGGRREERWSLCLPEKLLSLTSHSSVQKTAWSF